MSHATKQITLGVIIGNRGFFPTHLCEDGRATILKVLEDAGIKAIVLSPDVSPYGSIESIDEARMCADLFRANRDEIDGVLVTLPNFGDERAIANALRWAELDVPVLIHAFPDEVAKMDLANRRDSFCGKMSACNNLMQYGIKYSITKLHTVDPESESFRADLEKFVKVCRVVGGLKNARFGQLGARPLRSIPFDTAKGYSNEPVSPSRLWIFPTPMAVSNNLVMMKRRCRRSWRKSKITSTQTASPPNR